MPSARTLKKWASHNPNPLLFSFSAFLSTESTLFPNFTFPPIPAVFKMNIYNGLYPHGATFPLS